MRRRADPSDAPWAVQATDRDGRLLRAGLGAVGDAAFLGIGLAAGWFTGGAVLVGAWAQAATPLLAVPIVLLHAAHRAPDDPAVNAGKATVFNDRSFRGPAAARMNAAFSTFHFGIFTVVLGGFSFILAERSGYGAASAAALSWLAIRAVMVSLPTAVADARFLAADGYAHLAGKTETVMVRPYLRIVPLHLGILAVAIASDVGVGMAALDPAIIVIVVTMTFAASLQRPRGA
jgi:hypothetical protein